MYTFLLVIFVVSVLLLIPVILLQSGSGAQSGIFGGDITLGAFGAKTSEVLVNFTKWLVGIFMVTSFLMGWIKVQEAKVYSTSQQQQQQQQANQDLSAASNATTNAASGDTNTTR
jgi:protein translocase SecG subunit